MKSTVSKKLVKFDSTPTAAAKDSSELRPKAVIINSPKYLSFPLDVFPNEMQELIAELSTKLGLFPDWCGTAALTYLAGAIGAKARLHVRGTWVSPCSLFSCLVGDSGFGKTPIISFFKKPFFKIEKRYQNEYVEAIKAHKAAKSRAQELKIPFDDELPQRKNAVIIDANTESIDNELCSNPHGIFIQQNELIALFNSMNRYRSGPDAQKYLDYADGNEIKVNRIGRSKFLSFSNVCIFGGTQYKKLCEIAGNGRNEDGMVFRILFSLLPQNSKRQYLPDEDVFIDNEDYYERVFMSLFNIPFDSDQYNEPKPNILEWSKEARQTFNDWLKGSVDSFNRANVVMQKSLISKFEGILPRLALILELLSQATENPNFEIRGMTVSKKSVLGAIKLVDYFSEQSLRVQGSIHNLATVSEKPSRVEWNKLFPDSETCFKSGQIKDWLFQTYGIPHRTGDNLLKELTAVEGSYGVYKI